jgi:Flp pilus assembly protein TadD
LLGWQQVAERTRTVLAGLGAGIFLLHPLQTESVAYVASRSEVLSVGILMLAYVVFLYRPNVEIDWVRAAAVLVLFGAATATKEHSVVLPVLLVMTDYYFNPGWRIEGIRRNWRLYAPIAAGAVLAVALVFKVLSTATTAGFGMKDLRWYEYFFTQCRVVWSYLRLYVWPYPLNLDPDVAIARSPADPGAAAGLLALIALTAVAWIYRRRFPLSSFGILATLLMLAPTSSFAPLRDPMAEHRMYLPFFALTLVPLELLARWRPAADTVRLAAIGGALLLVLGIATYQRNFVWADPVALWQDAAAKSPGKARPHFQLAYAYFGAGRHLDATREYAKAAALDKPDARLLLDWALAADAAGLSAEAEKHLRQALQLERSAHVLATLGMVQAKQGKRAEALVSLSEAEKADGNFEMIYFYRGNVLLENGDPAAAIAQYQRTLALNPGNAPARQMLAEAQKRAGPR